MANPWDNLTPIPDGASIAAQGSAAPWAALQPVPEAEKPAHAISPFMMGMGDPSIGMGQLGVHLSGGYPVDASGQGLGTVSWDWLHDDHGIESGPATVKAIDDMVKQREATYDAQRRTQVPGISDPEAMGAMPTLGLDWSRLAGNAASPVNYMAPSAGGAGWAGRLVQGMIGGGVTSIMQPATGDNFAGEKAEQALGGTLVGGAMSPVANALQGAIPAAVNKLTDMGVQLSPGQSGGVIARLTEALGSKLPVARNLMSGQLDNSVRTFARGAYSNALSHIGEKLPDGMTDIGEISKTANQIASDQYQKILPNLSFTPGSDPSGTYLNGVADIAKKLTQILPEKAPAFYAAINPILTDSLKGDALKEADSLVGSEAREWMNSGTSVADRKLGQAIADARGLFRDHLRVENPEYAPQLDALDRTWAMLGVADQAGRRSLGDMSEFTPAQLMSASARSAGNSPSATRQLVHGGALQQPYAQAGQQVIGSRRTIGNHPLSSADLIIADALGAGLGLGGAGAAAAGEHGDGPDWLKWGALIGAPALAFSRPGQSALSALGPGRAMRGLFGQGVVGAPAGAAGGFVNQYWP